MKSRSAYCLHWMELVSSQCRWVSIPVAFSLYCALKKNQFDHNETVINLRQTPSAEEDYVI